MTGYITLPDKNAGQAILHFKNPYLARLPMLGTRYTRFLEPKQRTKPLSQDATFILSAFLNPDFLSFVNDFHFLSALPLYYHFTK
ncbi:MAG: hypothetical protein ACI85O_003649 [Saprospiraceae bacterium]